MYSYQNNSLYFTDYALLEVHQEVSRLLKQEYDYSGPYYIYNQEVLEQRIHLLEHFLPLCSYFFSVKSCSNISILNLLQKRKNWGVDVVSKGEIIRSLKAGFDPQKIVFAGIGKSQEEILFGLANNIRSFHVESISELKKIEELAKSVDTIASVTLRVNPDITVETHKYIQTGQYESKFGISKEELNWCKKFIEFSSSIVLKGLQIHLGSQILSSEPYHKALDTLIKLRQEFSSFAKIEYLSLGGGFGVDYNSILGTDDIQEFPIEKLSSILSTYKDSSCEIMIEPGRYISAYAGILITNILYIKKKEHKNIVIVDTGMTELIRPMLYQSSHPIFPLLLRGEKKITVDVVGPICESGDVFARNILITEVQENDVLSILHTGAYGSTMASQYNTRALIPEVLLSKGSCNVIRKPQTYEHLLELENVGFNQNLC